MILPAALGAVGCGIGWMGWAVRGRSSQVFAPSIWKGPSDRRAVALTFDDGPSESTERVLELLDRHGAKATFFQIGKHVERLPRVTSQVAQSGCEVGNHSYSHPRFDFTSATFQTEELVKTQRAIEAACGVTAGWFRAPFGVRWFGTGEAQRACGLSGAMWTLLARDWRLGAPAIERLVVTNVASGSILCFHDGRGLGANPDISSTVAALTGILPVLKDQGFALVTLSDLMTARGKT